MEFNPKNTMRQHFLSMKPYSFVEHPETIAARYNIRKEDILKLDANENSYGLDESVLKAVAEFTSSTSTGYNRYPDPLQVELCKSVSDYSGIPTKNIVMGAGADEVLDFICRLYLAPRDCAILFTPTFSYYKHVIAINEGEIVEIPTDKNFSIDPTNISNSLLERTRLIFVCSPNNPTGTEYSVETIEAILKLGKITIIDEAYVEFQGESRWKALSHYRNAIFLRTFSKCFAMAGFRLGYGVMDEDIVNTIFAFKPPFSISTPAERALQANLKLSELHADRVRKICQSRDRLITDLRKSPYLNVFDSSTNFVFCGLPVHDVGKIRTELEKLGIFIRHYPIGDIHNFLRISIGTESQMSRFTNEFLKLIDSGKHRLPE